MKTISTHLCLFVLTFCVTLDTSCSQILSSNQSPTCLYDDRMSSLRCQNTNLRTIKSNLERLSDDVRIVFINFGRVRLILGPLISQGSRHLNLSRISLLNSGLEKLSTEAFNGLEHVLEHVDLSGNKLSSFPKAVLNLVNLKTLNLNDNLIKSLPHGSAFNNLNTLTTLNLGNNLLGNRENVVPDVNERLSNDNNNKNKSPLLLRRPLSLLTFNLEPLTDTLEQLDLSYNKFHSLPKQLQERRFERLRHLDVSGNPIRIFPRNSFSGMTRLESLNLEKTGIQRLNLEAENGDSVTKYLSKLNLDGNPLRCDCDSRWLWKLATRNSTKSKIEISLPACATPFSVKNRLLTDLKDFELCEVLPNDGTPRFFRVTAQDIMNFPPKTFESLQLRSVIPVSSSQLKVKWKLWIDFYYSNYDWGLIFREIGVSVYRNHSMFYKTGYDLSNHLEKYPDWTPRTEVNEAELEGLKADAYYEICLAAIDHATVYYIHRKNCREIRMLPEKENEQLLYPQSIVAADIGSKRPNVSFLPDTTSITVKWRAEHSIAQMSGKYNVVRRITLRQFGHQNLTQLYVLENLNSTDQAFSSNASRHYTISHLKPSSAYVICFQTLFEEEKISDFSSRTEKNLKVGEKYNMTCQEIVTLDTFKQPFPVKEVATASAVSTSTTVFIIILVCCCCCPGFCGKNRKKNKKQTTGSRKEMKPRISFIRKPETITDENDNHHVKETDDEDRDGDDEGSQQVRGITAINSQRDNSEGYDTEISSNHFRSTIVHPDIIASNGSINYQSSVSKRFWQSCLPPTAVTSTFKAPQGPNSSLYSQYDYTLHSEATTALNASAKRDNSNLEENNLDTDQGDDAEEPITHIIDASSSLGRKKDKKKKSRRTFSTVKSQSKSRRSSNLKLPENPQFLYESMPLASIGPGSYHTISHYQIYRRPDLNYYSPPRTDYYPQFNVVPAPSLGFNRGDYAKTLGRKRQESPMATIPLQAPALEMRSIRKAKFSRDNNKMNTWSPYSASEFMPFYSDYPYRLREPFLSAITGGKKKIEELRF